MKIEMDHPILDAKHDLLGRDEFARELADSIIDANQCNRDGLVIGIEGHWGNGKTSFINLVKNHFNNKMAVKTFNSWLSSDHDSLITEFFKNILKDESDGTPALFDECMKDRILEYGKNFTRELVRSISIPCGPIHIDFSNIVDSAKTPTIKEQKDKLINTMLEKGSNVEKGIVYFIDDIDRLSDEEISTIFQLVKNIADFPHITYVLVYDRDVVECALDRVQQNHGRHYLQKIVQVSFSLPEPDPERINMYLNKKIESSILHIMKTSPIDKAHYYYIVKILMDMCIHNIRDCNRLYNAFMMRYQSLQQDFDIGDLLGITALNIYIPEVIQILSHNKFIMCGKENSPFIEVKKETAEKVSSALLHCRPDSKRQSLQSLINEMFPKFSQVAGQFSGHETTYSPKATNKICDIESINRYFRLTIDESEVSQAENITLLTSADEEFLLEKFSYWNSREKMKSILKKCGILLSEYPKHKDMLGEKLTIDQFTAWIHVLSKIKLVSEYSFLDMDVNSYRDLALYNFLRAVAPDNLWEVSCAMFRDSNNSLSILIPQLHHLSQGNSWYGTSKEYQEMNCIFSLEKFMFLKNIFYQRIEKEAGTHKLLDEESLSWILGVWEYGEADKYHSYLMSVQEAGDLARLISSYMERQIANGDVLTTMWNINLSRWPKELILSECYKKMCKFIQQEQFKELDKEKQENIYAFMRCFEKQNGKYDQVQKVGINELQ